MIHGDILSERARISPAATALVEIRTHRRFSYRELDARAAACARFLSEELGLGVGDRFSILSHNRVEFIDLLFGAAKSGSILVPLNTRLAARELKGILSDSGAGVLFFDALHLQAALELSSRHPELFLIGLDGKGPGIGWDFAEALARNSSAAFPRVRLSPEPQKTRLERMSHEENLYRKLSPVEIRKTLRYEYPGNCLPQCSGDL